MSDMDHRRKKGLFRRLALPLFVLLVASVTLFLVNWQFVASDIINLRNERANLLSSESKERVLSPPVKSSIPSVSLPGRPVVNLPSQQDANVPKKEPSLPKLPDVVPVKDEESSVSLSQQESVHSEASATSNDSDQDNGADSTADSKSCRGTSLESSVSKSSVFSIDDFDCSESNQGWKDHVPGPTPNSTRSPGMWKKRMEVLSEFSSFQDNFDFDDDTGKYIVFYPIFAGIGNNLAVFAEVLLIALRSHRKFLVYDWDTLRDYFYLPFHYEVIREKVWERDPSTLFVLKTNECPFDPVSVVQENEQARFIVMRSTCLTTQHLTKVREEKRWFIDHGIAPRGLVSPQEVAHHIYRFLYHDVMVPRPWVQEMIDDFKRETAWDSHYTIGIHVRTGGVSREGTRWGRFLNEKDVKLFERYALFVTRAYEEGKPMGVGRAGGEVGKSVMWYVLSDQEYVKDSLKKKYPQYVVYTNCDMTHTNKGRTMKHDPGFTCALVENYLLSSADIMVLTSRSTYGYLARHRSNAPYVAIDLGDYDRWLKKSEPKKKELPVAQWNADDV